MGALLAEGLVRSGQLSADQITVTRRDPEGLRELSKRTGFKAADSNREAADPSDIVLIAVKPADVPALLEELARTITRRHLVISIAAGVKTSSIEAGLPMAGPIVRAMPNVAARVGEAMTAIAAGDRTAEPDLEKAEELFSSVGRVVRVPEHALDAVTAISGSGPALLAFVAEAMIDAGKSLGLTPDLTAELTGQTMLGTGALLQRAGMSAAELREAVTSPRGTTEAALKVLRNQGVGENLKSALIAAAERARELTGD